jgi:hypothetical protein
MLIKSLFYRLSGAIMGWAGIFNLSTPAVMSINFNFMLITAPARALQGLQELYTFFYANANR